MDNAKKTCGFIGLGSQGAPMARKMIEAGYPTYLWARRAESLQPYAETAALYADSVEGLGSKADHVGLCVVNDDDVREMASRLIPAMKPGSLLAVHSTVHPETCRDLARQAGARNIHLVDAPVSGGAPAAEAGVLTLMVGAATEAFEQAKPVFETFGKLIVLLGDVGAGQFVKLINNSLFVANLGLADAAFEACAALGVDKASLLELLAASSGRSFALDVRGRMDSAAGFRHGGALLRKDLGLLTELLGTTHPAAVCLSQAGQRFLDAATVD